MSNTMGGGGFNPISILDPVGSSLFGGMFGGDASGAGAGGAATSDGVDLAGALSAVQSSKSQGAQEDQAEEARKKALMDSVMGGGGLGAGPSSVAPVAGGMPSLS